MSGVRRDAHTSDGVEEHGEPPPRSENRRIGVASSDDTSNRIWNVRHCEATNRLPTDVPSRDRVVRRERRGNDFPRPADLIAQEVEPRFLTIQRALRSVVPIQDNAIVERAPRQHRRVWRLGGQEVLVVDGLCKRVKFPQRLDVVFGPGRWVADAVCEHDTNHHAGGITRCHIEWTRSREESLITRSVIVITVTGSHEAVPLLC